MFRGARLNSLDLILPQGRQVFVESVLLLVMLHAMKFQDLYFQVDEEVLLAIISGTRTTADQTPILFDLRRSDCSALSPLSNLRCKM